MNEQLTKITDGWKQKSAPTFSDLSDSVLQTHLSAQSTAIRAINQMATLRNWLIGCYIVEYEQKGSDRAKYGERLRNANYDSFMTMDGGHSYMTLAWLVRMSWLSRRRPVLRSIVSRKTCPLR